MLWTSMEGMSLAQISGDILGEVVAQASKEVGGIERDDDTAIGDTSTKLDSSV